MKKLLLLTLLLLVACQPSAEAIEKLDLSEIAFRDNELPAGYTPGEIYESGRVEVDRNSKFAEFDPVNNLHQGIEYEGEKSGSISLSVHKSPEVSNIKIDTFIDMLIEREMQLNREVYLIENIYDLGDRAIQVAYYDDNAMHTLIVFYRCNAYFSGVISSHLIIDDFADYARSLDKRLIEYCK